MSVGLLPEALMQRGGDPRVLSGELLDIIRNAIENHPRTLQKRIGPSEIGDPCARRIGYKLMGAPDLNPFKVPNWKAFIGTAMHEKLEKVFASDNMYWLGQGVEPGDQRWLIESKVRAGTIGPEEIDGHSDLYDRVTCTVVDWKLVGPAPMKNYKTNGPGDQYRTQAHAYGRGFVRRGLPVDVVMIMFLPRNGELHETYPWWEAYDERVAIAGFTRANAIRTVVDTLGTQGLAQLPTADAYCYRCPYHRSGSVDLTQGCPGHPGSQSTPKPALRLTGKPA